MCVKGIEEIKIRLKYVKIKRIYNVQLVGGGEIRFLVFVVWGFYGVIFFYVDFVVVVV